MTGELKAQERALDPDRALRLLRRASCCSAWKISRVLRLTPVNLRRGRRMVVRYVVEASPPGGASGVYTLYGKLYRGHGGARAWAATKFLEPRLPARVRLAEVLGYDARRRFLVLEGLHGELLSDVLGRDCAHTYLAAFGQVLAAFHGCGADPRGAPPARCPCTDAPSARVLRTHDAEAEVRVLELARARAEQAPWEPGVKSRFTAGLDGVVQALRSRAEAGADRGHTVVHRDLYPRQVLVAARRTPGPIQAEPPGEETFGLLDLDEVSYGEPEIDCGNLAAHLVLGDLQSLGVVKAAPTFAASFLAAYGQQRPLDGERLRAYTAGSLLRLASLERVSLPASSVLSWPVLASGLVLAAERVQAKGLLRP